MKTFIVSLGLLLATAAGAHQVEIQAAELGQHLEIGDMDAYYGLMPASRVKAHPATHPEAAMHGGVPGGRGKYHLVVTLLDQATRKQIRDARVTAVIEPLGMAPTRQALAPMRIAKTMSYGAYVYMREPGPYRITLEVMRPGYKAPVSVEFEHRMQ